MSIPYDHFDRESARTRIGPSLKDIATSGGMLQLRSLFRQIIRRGAVTIIASDGRVHHIGSGIPSVERRAYSRPSPLAIKMIVRDAHASFQDW